MKTVQTVTGSVSTADLGSVLMHEHLFSSSMGIATHYPNFYIDGIYDIIEAELNKIKAEGILTVVDATPVCLGRDVKGMKKVSEATGVNVIATTGWWGQKPPYVGNYPAEKYAEGFINDIRVGCDGTDIKAGILKAAMDTDGPTEWRKLTHYAAGMASVETGVKIMLHTYCPMETPRHQLKFLKEVGVDMNNVVVDHIPETTDMEFIRWIYDQGVWMGMDRIPCQHFEGEYQVSTQQRINVIKQMLDEGMGDRILFSHDLPVTSTLFDNQPDDVKAYLAEQKPDGLLFLKKHVFTALADMGVDPDYLWNLTIENPRKFFEG